MLFKHIDCSKYFRNFGISTKKYNFLKYSTNFTKLNLTYLWYNFYGTKGVALIFLGSIPWCWNFHIFLIKLFLKDCMFFLLLNFEMKIIRSQVIIKNISTVQHNSLKSHLSRISQNCYLKMIIFWVHVPTC